MPNLTQEFQRLINQARVELPGASDDGIYQALYSVFHEFFNNTSAWQEDINVSIVAGTTEYQLTPAEGGEFVRLMALLSDNNTPVAAVSNMTGLITLRDTPNSAATYTATIAKTIGIPVDRDGKPIVPDWTFSRFYTCIEGGLLGRLMMQPKKPYTNPAMAKYHLQRFRDQMGAVKMEVLHGSLYNAQAWSYPQSFAMSSQRGNTGTDTSFGG